MSPRAALQRAMFALASAVAPPIARFRINRAHSRAVRCRAASYDALSGYQKNRMAQAKTDADWAAIEKDVPGARAMHAAAQSTTQAQSAAKTDPMDQLCADDPGAIECKAFD